MFNSLFPNSPWSLGAAMMGGTAMGGGYAGMTGFGSDALATAFNMSSYVPQLWGYGQPQGATYTNGPSVTQGANANAMSTTMPPAAAPTSLSGVNFGSSSVGGVGGARQGFPNESMTPVQGQGGAPMPSTMTQTISAMGNPVQIPNVPEGPTLSATGNVVNLPPQTNQLMNVPAAVRGVLG